MNMLTLKIPAALDAALQRASTRRQISKSALVREALEKALLDELKQVEPAVQWLEQWRGLLSEQDAAQPVDERMAHILGKHLR